MINSGKEWRWMEEDSYERIFQQLKGWGFDMDRLEDTENG